jgi:hypothetical protein
VLILIWGVAWERPVKAVLEELDRNGAPVCLIEQRAVLEAEIELDVGREVGGFLRVGGRVIDLAEISACYLRPYAAAELPEIVRAGPESAAWRHAAEMQDVLSCWTEITPALVVNRFGAMASNGSKPYQLTRIRELGFAVPETLVTTAPEAVRAFWEQHGEVVYKSVSAVRSRVSRLTEAHLERLGDVASCPTQFQQYIPGIDYRVHVVGEEVFACSVTSGADDYRYPGPDGVALAACRLPPEMEERCRCLAAALDLPLAGIDLRRSRVDGEWYCFEVNPSPGFSYYEEVTGLPIGAAIARLLIAGGRPRAARRSTTMAFEARDASPA